VGEHCIDGISERDMALKLARRHIQRVYAYRPTFQPVTVAAPACRPLRLSRPAP